MNENNPADNMQYEGNEANDLPYKDDTSDGTTAAKTPQEIAEETVDQVKSSDDLARVAAGIDHPEEGHDVRDYRPEIREAAIAAATDPQNPGHPDYQPQAPEHAGDDAGVDEHGDDPAEG